MSMTNKFKEVPPLVAMVYISSGVRAFFQSQEGIFKPTT